MNDIAVQHNQMIKKKLAAVRKAETELKEYTDLRKESAERLERAERELRDAIDNGPRLPGME